MPADRLGIARDCYRAYEAEKQDGARFRNTEILSFDGDLVGRVEVYFGWNLD